MRKDRKHMKFVKGTTKKKLVIPNAVMELGGFEKGAPVEICALPDAVAVLKKEMTAMELIRAVDSLQRLSVELLVELIGVCDPCEDCGNEKCAAALESTDVPEWVLSVLESWGVCLEDLEKLLMSEDIVYGYEDPAV